MVSRTKRMQAAIAALQGLTRAELEQLRGVLSTLLSEGYLDTEPPGYIELKYITRNGKRYGPYKYRRVWVDGKLTSTYLGKEARDEIAETEKKP
ncbi:MAG: hypothetical protein K8S97_08470 [Anaerolineae bacterium]|nr:hypothetical protein [Anaerolineae bacterium]